MSGPPGPIKCQPVVSLRSVFEKPATRPQTENAIISTNSCQYSCELVARGIRLGRLHRGVGHHGSRCCCRIEYELFLISNIICIFLGFLLTFQLFLTIVLIDYYIS